jgi:UDP:flavonoid glycosyltransferase YjiC (YdhE family)
VVIATSEIYRGRVLADGLEFHPIRPDLAVFVGDREVLRRIWNPLTGSEYLVRAMMLPHLEDTFADLLAASAGADAILTHLLLYAAPIAAEVLGIPAIAIALQPSAFFSVYDPPVLAPMPWTYSLRHFGPTAFRLIFWLGSLRTRRWSLPIHQLRQRLGLPALEGDPSDPIIGWAAHGAGAQGWFSPLFGAPQPDWPANSSVTGFPFYASGSPALSAATQSFLDSGEPPIAFTLGSAAVAYAGNFFAESAKAAHLLGRRAVLLVGEGDAAELASDSVHVSPYEPHGALFPRCAAVVHQCGIGTSAEALRAGVPVLAVPWGHDQFDNAQRIQRLGCGVVMRRGRYRAQRVAEQLRSLLDSEAIRAKTAAVAQQIRAEDGVASACDAVERMVAAQT